MHQEHEGTSVVWPKAHSPSGIGPRERDRFAAIVRCKVVLGGTIAG